MIFVYLLVLSIILSIITKLYQNQNKQIYYVNSFMTNIMVYIFILHIIYNVFYPLYNIYDDYYIIYDKQYKISILCSDVSYYVKNDIKCNETIEYLKTSIYQRSFNDFYSNII